jgi:hypothetical protein
MHCQVKIALKDCAERKKRKESGYGNVTELTESIKHRLIALVGDQYWKKANDYLIHFIEQKRKQYAAARVATNTTATRTTTAGGGANSRSIVVAAVAIATGGGDSSGGDKSGPTIASNSTFGTQDGGASIPNNTQGGGLIPSTKTSQNYHLSVNGQQQEQRKRKRKRVQQQGKRIVWKRAGRCVAAIDTAIDTATVGGVGGGVVRIATSPATTTNPAAAAAAAAGSNTNRSVVITGPTGGSKGSGGSHQQWKQRVQQQKANSIVQPQIKSQHQKKKKQQLTQQRRLELEQQIIELYDVENILQSAVDAMARSGMDANNS